MAAWICVLVFGASCAGVMGIIDNQTQPPITSYCTLQQFSPDAAVHRRADIINYSKFESRIGI